MMSFRSAAAGLSLLPIAAAAMAQQAPLPRSGSVDVPIEMTGIPPLLPMTMTAVDGPRRFSRAGLHGTFNGRTVAYRADLDEVLLRDGDGSPIGTMFTASYIAGPGGRDAERRPVIFAFNGGPGGASALLRFASLGPQRLAVTSTAALSRPDNCLIDNSVSPLDVADLVFIDAMDTGYGRSVAGKAGRVRSVDGDSEAFTQVVLNWLRRHGRMGAPVFVLGESYGTLRAVAMARDLARSPEKVVVSGIVLAGTAFTFGANGRTPNPMYVAAKLPMMASMAWHYGKIDRTGQTWEQAVDKARAFVRDRYAGAVMQGNRLDPATRESVVRALPGIIGIPEEYFRRNKVIAVANFNAELLRAEGRELDGNDGRASTRVPVRPVTAPAAVTGPAHPADLVARLLAHYAAVARVVAEAAAAMPGTAALGDYRLLDADAIKPGYWDLRIAGDPALDVTLAKLLDTYPAMQLLVLQGRYDTLTDFGTTEYMLGQTNVAPSRYRIAFYDGGHALNPEPEAIQPLREAVLAAQSPR